MSYSPTSKLSKNKFNNTSSNLWTQLIKFLAFWWIKRLSEYVNKSINDSWIVYRDWGRRIYGFLGSGCWRKWRKIVFCKRGLNQNVVVSPYVEESFEWIGEKPMGSSDSTQSSHWCVFGEDWWVFKCVMEVLLHCPNFLEQKSMKQNETFLREWSFFNKNDFVINKFKFKIFI